MKRRTTMYLVVVVVGVLSLLAAACAKPGPAPSPATTPTATSTPKSTTVPAPTAGVKARTFKVTTHAPADDPRTWSLTHFFDALKSRTKEALNFEIYAEASLIKAEDQHKALETGVTDFAYLPFSYWLGEFPLGNFECLPFAYDYDVFKKIGTDQRVLDILNEQLRARNMRILYFVAGDPHRFFTKFPVNSLNDLKQKKIRASGGLAWDFIQGVGMSPVKTTPPELYSAAQSGIVDGAYVSLGSHYGFKLQEILRYCAKANPAPLHYTACPAMISLVTWNSLSPELQKIMLDVAPESTVWSQDSCRQYEAKIEKQLVDAKLMSMYNFTQPEIATMKAWTDKWVQDVYVGKNGVPAQKLVSVIKELSPYWK